MQQILTISGRSVKIINQNAVNISINEMEYNCRRNIIDQINDTTNHYCDGFTASFGSKIQCVRDNINMFEFINVFESAVICVNINNNQEINSACEQIIQLINNVMNNYVIQQAGGIVALILS